MALVFPKNPYPGIIFSAGDNRWTWDGVAWNLLPLDEYELPIATNTTIGGVKVDGVSVVIDDTGTITALSGAEVTLTNGYETISVAGQNPIVATSPTDTLTLIAGTGISILTDSETDSITINNTVTAPTVTFSSLTELSNASLTVDKMYLPAITMLVVTSNGALSYRFDQYDSTDNPTIYAISGTTIAFNLQSPGHPFLVKDNANNNYNTGLVHVSALGIVSSGTSAQGKDTGTVYWKIPAGISGEYRYQCSAHLAMAGTIVIKNIALI
jgi:plastocyanin